MEEPKDWINKFCEDIKRNRIYYGNILLSALKIIDRQNNGIKGAIDNIDNPQKALAHLNDSQKESNLIAKILLEDLPVS